MPVITTKTPGPGLANRADLAFIHGQTVLLIVGEELYVHEQNRRAHRFSRSTPSVLAARGSVKSLLAFMKKQWPRFAPLRVFSDVHKELYAATATLCMLCGGATSHLTPCACEREGAYYPRCTFCLSPSVGSICNAKHCGACCDCWYPQCGCGYFTYKHGEAGAIPPMHYEWRLGDTMHAAHSCFNCRDHCKCILKCEGCGETHLAGRRMGCTTCQSKKHMDECCPYKDNPDTKFAAGREGRIEFHHYAKPTFYESKTFEKNQSKRFLSPEIEIASYHAATWPKIMQFENLMSKLRVPIVRDLSVTDGLELNMPPANGDIFIANLTRVCKALNKINPRITDRCGIHVHGDARDFSGDDVGKLLRIFLCVEPLVWNIVSDARKNAKWTNGDIRVYWDFAKPGIEHLKKLHEFLYSGEEEYALIRKSLKKNTDSQTIRYRGLNLHSYFYQQTIEFRHHHGSTDEAEIGGWAMFCGFLMDTAKTLDWKAVLEIPTGIANPKQFTDGVLKILPRNAPNIDAVADIVSERYAEFGRRGEEEVFDEDNNRVEDLDEGEEEDVQPAPQPRRTGTRPIRRTITPTGGIVFDDVLDFTTAATFDEEEDQ